MTKNDLRETVEAPKPDTDADKQTRTTGAWNALSLEELLYLVLMGKGARAGCTAA